MPRTQPLHRSLSPTSIFPTVVGPSSPRPSSLSTINIKPSIPMITSITLLPSSHNVSLTVIMATASDTAGALFCIAMSKGKSPTSIDAVKSGGTMRQYLTSTKPITIVIPGLLALASYKAYCYFELSDGSGSAYADMISMSRAFSTSCCREVLFSNAPKSVYGDVSLYSQSANNDLSNYVFSYYLESAPSKGSIVITPLITLANGNVSNYSPLSVPSSLEFLSSYTSSRLKGQFYLSAAKSTSGTFLISLVVSGDDSGNFTTASRKVNVLSISQPLSPPALVSCIFDSSGGFFTVNFDKATDQANILANTWPCKDLLIFNDVDTTICSWTSLSTIKVVFLSATALSVKPKDILFVRGGLLRAACRLGTNCNDNYVLRSQHVHTDVGVVPKISGTDALLTSALSINVQRPVFPVAPTILVIVPTQIGTCNDLLIDLSASTGNGGRPWASIAWSVKAENGNATALAGFLTNNFNLLLNYLIVPRSLLSRTTYAIGATVTNFLGDFASSTSIISVSGDPNLPVAFILGPVTRTMKAVDTLSLRGSAFASKCGLTSLLTYNWSLTNASGTLMFSKSTSPDQRLYIAPAYSFIAGSSYFITLTVIALSSKGQLLSSAYAVTNIYVSHGNIIAAVRGGYVRESAVDKPLILDASISSDEDTSTGSKGLLFSWSCSIISLTNFGSACNFSSISVPLPSTSLLSLPANQMVLSTKYSFLVTATSADGRSASQTVTVTPLLSGSPVVLSNNLFFKFNEDSPMIITGSITANVSIAATWTAFSNGVQVSLDRAYTVTVREFTANEMSATPSYPLAVLPNTFVAGRTYTFRLSAHPLNNVLLSARTEVVLTVNAPPTGGKTTVAPLRGHALVTDFSMSTTGWSDDLSDYPLSYSFSYQLAVSDFTPALILAAFSPLSNAVSLLPAGLRGGSSI